MVFPLVVPEKICFSALFILQRLKNKLVQTVVVVCGKEAKNPEKNPPLKFDDNKPSHVPRAKIEPASHLLNDMVHFLLVNGHLGSKTSRLRPLFTYEQNMY